MLALPGCYLPSYFNGSSKSDLIFHKTVYPDMNVMQLILSTIVNLFYSCISVIGSLHCTSSTRGCVLAKVNYRFLENFKFCKYFRCKQTWGWKIKLEEILFIFNMQNLPAFRSSYSCFFILADFLTWMSGSISDIIAAMKTGWNSTVR